MSCFLAFYCLLDCLCSCSCCEICNYVTSVRNEKGDEAKKEGRVVRERKANRES